MVRAIDARVAFPADVVIQKENIRQSMTDGVLNAQERAMRCILSMHAEAMHV